MIGIYPFLNGRAVPEAGFSWIAAAVTAIFLLAVVGLAWRALRTMRRDQAEHAAIPRGELPRAA